MDEDYEYFRRRLELTDNFDIKWKQDRPKSDYRTEHGWKCFIKMCAGKSAETIHDRKGCIYKVLTMNDRHGIKKSYLSHRVVWLLYYGEWPGGQIDHLDGNGLNNHISNLRVVNNSENAKNRKLISTNTSGISGVFFEKSRGKWRVRLVCKDGKRRSFGSYTNKEDAIKARNDVILEHGYTIRHGRSSP